MKSHRKYTLKRIAAVFIAVALFCQMAIPQNAGAMLTTGANIFAAKPAIPAFRFAYDANGNVTSITPPSKPAHGFSHTPVDLVSEYTPPNVGAGTNVTTYAYNLDKQPTLITRPDGQTIDFAYDFAGRLSTVTVPTGLYLYGYDTAGRLSTLTLGAESLLYSYDGSLPLSTTWTGPVAGKVARVFNNNFWVTGLAVNGSTITYAYDNDGLLTGAGSMTLARDAANGLLNGTTLGNTSDTWGYNTFAEPTSYNATVSGSSAYAATFTRDKLGRITDKTETISGTADSYHYTYDVAGRLTDVAKNSVLVGHYEYDSNGNRLVGTVSGVTANGTYDDQDRLQTYGPNTYSYTANGELQSKTNADGTTTYNYDVLGNLRTVTLADGTNIEYITDGQNRRIGKKVNGSLTQGFLYSRQLQIVAELDGTGNVASRFVYADRANVPAYMIKSGVTYRIIADHLGSPRLVVNTADGTVAQRLDYDEFGNIAADSNPGFIPFGFAGGLYDQHCKLVRFGARNYDPESGRWTVKDPIRFNGGDTNLFGYVLNDPINFIDPPGLWKFYGNYGGPDWTGGQTTPYENLTAEQQRALPGPIDSMDELFRRHDMQYSNARVRRDKAMKSCPISGGGQDQAEKEFEIETDLADDILGRELDKLNNDPSLWSAPAPDPAAAKKALKRARTVF